MFSNSVTKQKFIQKGLSICCWRCRGDLPASRKSHQGHIRVRLAPLHGHLPPPPPLLRHPPTRRHGSETSGGGCHGGAVHWGGGVVQVEGCEQEDSGSLPESEGGCCKEQVVKHRVAGYHGNQEVSTTSSFRRIFGYFL